MKVKVNKKWLKRIALSSTIAFSTTLGAYLCIKNGSNDVVDNQIGHSDINPYFNFKVKETDFVIINVGNHEEVGVSNQNAKIDYCNKHDIQLGIIVKSDFTKENEIYDNVEYVKSLIRDKKIDYPVYMDINDIITNNDLNVEMKTKLINDFLEKCSANNMYVGVYGTDNNLVRLKKYCNIKDYDAYLVMDKENISYDGTYSIVKDLNGCIIGNKNLSEPIRNKNLNNSEKFQGDGAYIVKENDDIIDIAMNYGLSVNELLKFNEIEEISVGTVLRIPGIINNVVNDGGVTLQSVDTPLKGVDLSYCQGDNTNFEQLNTNTDFAIIKCSQGKNLDTCFSYNALNCMQNNIPIGVYCFNDYKGIDYKNQEEFIRIQGEQTDFIIENLKNKKIDYPVYLDIEVSGNLEDYYDFEDIKDMLQVWNDKITSAGYIPGIYSNMSALNYINKCTDISNLQLWIAGGNQYLGEKDSIEYNDVYDEGKTITYKNNTYTSSMRQVTDSAINSGAGNSLGHVDVNYSYIDYTKKNRVNDNESYYFNIKEFNRFDLKKTILLSSLGLSLIPGAFIFKKIKNKKKTK